MRSMQLLDYSPNPFGGVVVNPLRLEDDASEFRGRLSYSLDAWRDEGHKVAWLEIPTHLAGLIPIAVEAGFVFHHANEHYALLTIQLLDGAYVPPFASHYIGAGGVVISDDEEILVVSERHRRRSRGPAYKLPGGALLAGEHLKDGVVREVFEETGVRTAFVSLVCFRHWHGYRYDKSDIYFVCRLSPLTREIRMQEEELEEALWMPVNEYLGDPDVSLFNKRIVRSSLESPGVVPATIEGYAEEDRYEFFMPKINEGFDFIGQHIR